jgi:hypothetical protein
MSTVIAYNIDGDVEYEMKKPIRRKLLKKCKDCEKVHSGLCEKGTETVWYCDWEDHENEKIFADGKGGYYCELCDEEAKSGEHGFFCSCDLCRIGKTLCCDIHKDEPLFWSKRKDWDCAICQDPEEACAVCEERPDNCECE